MRLTLGFSPCPNDTFIFDALVNQKIDTGDLVFDVVLEDVQTLNRWAKEGLLDISKVSYGVVPKITSQYVVLRSGGALGRGVGPLLVSASSMPIPLIHSDESLESEGEKMPENLSISAAWQRVNQGIIAIPGEDTTAHFLFSQAYPKAQNKVFMRFNEIEDWVISAERDVSKGGHPAAVGNAGGNLQKFGVIIHENRFTYQQKGLYKVADLGEYWEQSTGNPIPLGGIVMKRGFDTALQQRVDSFVRESLAYAFRHYPEVAGYVRSNAQEMSEDVMRQHIDLYVNDFSLALGENGVAAVMQLMKTLGGQDYAENDVFVLRS